MKTAVSTVFVGKKRDYNRRFQEMCSHHLVEPVAEPMIDARMNTLVFHLKVRLLCIVAAPLPSPPGTDSISHSEHHDLVF